VARPGPDEVFRRCWRAQPASTRTAKYDTATSVDRGLPASARLGDARGTREKSGFGRSRQTSRVASPGPARDPCQGTEGDRAGDGKVARTESSATAKPRCRQRSAARGRPQCRSGSQGVRGDGFRRRCERRRPARREARGGRSGNSRPAQLPVSQRRRTQETARRDQGVIRDSCAASQGWRDGRRCGCRAWSHRHPLVRSRTDNASSGVRTVCTITEAARRSSTVNGPA